MFFIFIFIFLGGGVGYVIFTGFELHLLCAVSMFHQCVRWVGTSVCAQLWYLSCVVHVGCVEIGVHP